MEPLDRAQRASRARPPEGVERHEAVGLEDEGGIEDQTSQALTRRRQAGAAPATLLTLFMIESAVPL